MKITMSAYVLVSAVLLYVAHGYPNGAPARAESCYYLQPVHTDQRTQQLVANQTAQAPYKIFVSRQEYVPCTIPNQCSNGGVQVVLQGQQNQIFSGAAGQVAPFRGFIIQARSLSGAMQSFGQFIPMAQTGDSKVIQCPNGFTLTHTVNNDKQMVRFNWVPSPNMREPVKFTATVVQSYNNIFPVVQSDIIKPRALATTVAGFNPPTTTTSSTTTTTTSLTTTTTTRKPSTTTRTTSTTTTPTTTSTTTRTSPTTTTGSPSTGDSEGLEGGSSGIAAGLGTIMASLFFLIL